MHILTHTTNILNLLLNCYGLLLVRTSNCPSKFIHCAFSLLFFSVVAFLLIDTYNRFSSLARSCYFIRSFSTVRFYASFACSTIYFHSPCIRFFSLCLFFFCSYSFHALIPLRRYSLYNLH